MLKCNVIICAKRFELSSVASLLDFEASGAIFFPKATQHKPLHPRR